jgi:hypothetical protein
VALSEVGKHGMIYIGGYEVVCSVGRYISGEALKAIKMV